MYFIDTHAHLYLDQFKEDMHQSVKDAITAGVDKILLPNISSETTNSMLKLSEYFPKNCFPMIGIHPCNINTDSIKKELNHVKEELEKRRYIAIGEIGIDLYWQKDNLQLQKEAFISQIELAKKYKLPVVIHVRDSFNEAIEIIENLNDTTLQGVFHCFSGDIKDAERIIDLQGFYLGIGGVLTFKNSNLGEIIKSINIKHLVLETDSPYLAPHPFRGKRNESKYLLHIAKKVAEIKQLELYEVAEHTTNNANQLFKL